MDSFNLHKVNWTKEKVSRYWDYMAENQPATYWSKATGKELINFVSKRIPLTGLIIDYGCGIGYLMEFLLDRKITSLGIETSEKSAVFIREKFEKNPLFKGVVKDSVGLASESADVIFLVEVLEHLLPEEVRETLSQICRILKTKGFLIITVSHNEDLGKKETICPDCGAVFHTMGHLRSFTAEDLIQLLSEFGFKKEFCQPVILEKVSPLKKIYWFFKEIAGKKMKKHCLIYIGKK